MVRYTRTQLFYDWCCVRRAYGKRLVQLGIIWDTLSETSLVTRCPGLALCEFERCDLGVEISTLNTGPGSPGKVGRLKWGLSELLTRYLVGYYAGLFMNRRGIFSIYYDKMLHKPFRK